MRHEKAQLIIIPELEKMASETRKTYWTEREILILREYYGKLPTKKLAEYLSRSITSVTNKAQTLGLQRNIRGCNDGR
jgi:hypothetical protein